MLLDVQQSVARETEVPLRSQLDDFIVLAAERRALALVWGDPLVAAVRLPLLQMTCRVVAPHRWAPIDIDEGERECQSYV